MRSGELARLAGVSVRTLRHYHQIGLMPEPSRHNNGYRDYQAEDLLRLLRIRRLVSLGLPLERISVLLDTLDAGKDQKAVDAELGLLDAQLEAQIAHLQEQRDFIARVRAAAVRPDVPLRSSEAIEAVADLAMQARTPPHTQQRGDDSADDEQLAFGIALHVYSDAELAEVARLAQAIVGRGLVDELYGVNRLFDSLAADADQKDVRRVAVAVREFVDKLIDCFSAENWLKEPSAYDYLLASLAKKDCNVAQCAIFDEVVRYIEKRLAVHRLSATGAGHLDPDAAS